MTTRERVLDVLAKARGFDGHADLMACASVTASDYKRQADALLAAGLIVTDEMAECVEACVDWREYHDFEPSDYRVSQDSRLCVAVDALLAARAPKPWRVDEHCPWVARGPNMVSRLFFKNNGSADHDTCAAEVARLNAEAAK